MTESDIYQLVGKAYCDGYQEGLEKQASLEKQALSPQLLLRAANMAKALGRGTQSLNLLGGARGRHLGQTLTELGTNAENLTKAIPSLRPRDAEQITKFLLNKGYKGYSGDTVARMLDAGKKYMPDYLAMGDSAGINRYFEHFGKGFVNKYKPINAVTAPEAFTL